VAVSEIVSGWSARRGAVVVGAGAVVAVARGGCGGEPVDPVAGVVVDIVPVAGGSTAKVDGGEAALGGTVPVTSER
jgi:hypothetical protein